MHGIVEAIAIVAFIATFLVASEIRRVAGSRPTFFLVLIAIWPLALLLFVGGDQAFDLLRWWGFYAFLGGMVSATVLGALGGAALSRPNGQRNSD